RQEGYTTMAYDAQRRYREKNPDKMKAIADKYRKENAEAIKDRHKAIRERDKLAALTHYSRGDHPECSCCGETNIQFLAIDHRGGGGNDHDRGSYRTKIHAWLRL